MDQSGPGEQATDTAGSGEATSGAGPDGRDAETDPDLRFARALGVQRNAKIALAVSTAFAALLYVLFVVVPSETTQSPVLYLGLAFVVLVSTTLLLTLVFTAISAWRLSREL